MSDAHNLIHQANQLARTFEKAAQEGDITAAKEAVEAIIGLYDDPNAINYGFSNAQTLFTLIVNQVDQSGILDLVEYLLDKGAYINVPHAGQIAPLQQAISAGNAKVAALLIERGADVNYVSQMSRYPQASAKPLLHIAIEEKQSDIALLLLEAGASMEVVPLLQPLLQLAAQYGQAEVAADLIRRGADVDFQSTAYPYTALSSAAQEDGNPVLPLLLEKGATIDLPVMPVGTALFFAAYHGAGRNIQLLLEQGANPNMEGGRGTALTTALNSLKPIENLSAIVKSFVEHGANLNTVGSYGDFALQDAVRLGSQEIVQILLDAGASLSPPSNWPISLLVPLASGGMRKQVIERHKRFFSSPDFAPLTNAERDAELRDAEEQDMQLALLLIQQGLDIAPKIHAATLQSAAESGHLAMIRLLADLGVDMNAFRESESAGSDDSQDYPLHVAIGKGHWEVAIELLRRGADPNVRSPHGQYTPLMAALYDVYADLLLQTENYHLFVMDDPLGWVIEGNLASIKALIEAGANLEEKTTTGFTALHLAASRAAPPAMQALLEASPESSAAKHAVATALHICVNQGRRSQLLKKHPQILNYIKTERPQRSSLMSFATQLKIATEWDETTLRMLLAAGADVSARDDGGYTPLHWAVMYATPNSVQMLLDAGADPNLLDNYDRTAIQLFLSYGHTAKILEKVGFSINDFEGLMEDIIAAAQCTPPGLDTILPYATSDLREAARQDIAILSSLMQHKSFSQNT